MIKRTTLLLFGLSLPLLFSLFFGTYILALTRYTFGISLHDSSKIMESKSPCPPKTIEPNCDPKKQPNFLPNMDSGVKTPDGRSVGFTYSHVGVPRKIIPISIPTFRHNHAWRLAMRKEDARSHNGVDLFAIWRASAKTLIGGNTASSTHEMQLVKLAFHPEETSGLKHPNFLNRFWYKTEQMAEAWALREFLSQTKTESEVEEWIGTNWSNVIYFGNGEYGVGVMAHRFGIDLPGGQLLPLSKAVTIVALLPNPSELRDPSNWKALAFGRKNILDLLINENKITKEEYIEALSELHPLVHNQHAIGKLYGVLNLPLLEEASSFTQSSLNQAEEETGVRDPGVTFTLAAYDDKLQSLLTKQIKLEEKNIQKTFPKPIVMFTMLNKRSEVMAMGISSGKFNYLDEGQLTPGSITKIITTGLWLDKTKASGNSLVLDAYYKNKWPSNNGYPPSGGSVSLTHAFSKSLNAPMVHMGDTVGFEHLGQKMQKLGFVFPKGNVFYPSISIGHGTAVSPLCIASVFVSLLNDGWYRRPVIYSEANKGAFTISKTKIDPKGFQLFSPRTSKILLDLMKGAASSGTGNSKTLQSASLNFRYKSGTADEVKWSAAILGEPSSDSAAVLLVAVTNHENKKLPGIARNISFPVLENVLNTLKDQYPEKFTHWQNTIYHNQKEER